MLCCTLLQLQPILPLDVTPLVQRAPIIQRLGGCGSDCRGKQVSPTKRAARRRSLQIALPRNRLPWLPFWSPFEWTGRLPIGKSLCSLAVSFFGLVRSNFCLSGRLSSKPVDFAAVLLAASVFGPARSHFSLSGCVSFDRAD